MTQQGGRPGGGLFVVTSDVVLFSACWAGRGCRFFRMDSGRLWAPLGALFPPGAASRAWHQGEAHKPTALT
jgi:hypothetical protein